MPPFLRACHICAVLQVLLVVSTYLFSYICSVAGSSSCLLLWYSEHLFSLSPGVAVKPFLLCCTNPFFLQCCRFLILSYCHCVGSYTLAHLLRRNQKFIRGMLNHSTTGCCHSVYIVLLCEHYSNHPLCTGLFRPQV